MWSKVRKARATISRESLEITLRNDPSEIKALKMLGKFHCTDASGDRRFGLQLLTRALKCNANLPRMQQKHLKSDPWYWRTLGHGHLEAWEACPLYSKDRFHLDTALFAFSMATLHMSTLIDGTLWYEYSIALMYSGQIRQAEKILAKLIGSFPNFKNIANAVLLAATTLFFRCEYDQAISYMNILHSNKAFPEPFELADAFVLMGLIHAKQLQTRIGVYPKESLEAYRQGFDLKAFSGSDLTRGVSTALDWVKKYQMWELYGQKCEATKPPLLILAVECYSQALKQLERHSLQPEKEAEAKLWLSIARSHYLSQQQEQAQHAVHRCLSLLPEGDSGEGLANDLRTQAQQIIARNQPQTFENSVHTDSILQKLEESVSEREQAVIKIQKTWKNKDRQRIINLHRESQRDAIQVEDQLGEVEPEDVVKKMDEEIYEDAALKIQSISRGRKARLRVQEQRLLEAQRFAEIEAEKDAQQMMRRATAGRNQDNNNSIALILAQYDAQVGSVIPSKLRSALLQCHSAQLVEMDLSGIDISQHVRLVETCLMLPRVTRVKLRGSNLGAEIMTKTGKNNLVTRQGISMVAEVMLTKKFYLCSVDLRENDLSVPAAVAIARGLARNGILQELGICRLTRMLPLNRLRSGRLNELSLASQGLGPSGAIVLAAILTIKSLFLISLDVTDNDFGLVGKKAVAEALFAREKALPLSTFRIDEWSFEPDDEELDLSRRHLIHVDALLLAAALKGGGLQLSKLELSHNTGIREQGAAAIAQLLKESTVIMETLEELRLENCGIGDEGATALASAIEIVLTAPLLSPPGLESTSSHVVNQPSVARWVALRTLDLRGNALRDRGKSALGRALGIGAGNSRPLEQLMKMTKQESLEDEDEDQTDECIKRKEGVEQLMLTGQQGGNPLRCGDLLLLAPAVQNLTSLTVLNLSHNKVGGWKNEAALCSLSDAVRAHPSLTELNLENAGIDSVGVAALGRMYGPGPECACGLTTLILGFNQLGANGAHRLMQAIVQGKKNIRQASLQVLDLRANGLGPRGAKLVANGLKWIGGQVRELRLAQNEIMKDGNAYGFLALVEVVQNHVKKLTKLDLDGNSMGGYFDDTYAPEVLRSIVKEGMLASKAKSGVIFAAGTIDNWSESPAEMRRLADMVTANNSLVSLSLQKNELQSKDVRGFLQVLLGYSGRLKLRTLRLSDNEIDSSTDQLIDATSKKHTMIIVP